MQLRWRMTRKHCRCRKNQPNLQDHPTFVAARRYQFDRCAPLLWDAFSLSEDLSITYISAASSDGGADTGAMSSLKMLKLARLGRILASQCTKKVPGYQWWCGCGVCATPPLCALLKINFAFEDKWLSLQRS